jgi:2-iminobutanoate/2-iminopropanoate deaminase
MQNLVLTLQTNGSLIFGVCMDKKIISTTKAPAAVGPYSQGVAAGNFLFISGQLGLDPATKTLITGSFEDQVKQAFVNLRSVAEAGGAQLADAVKLTLFLTDLSKFAVVNETMKQFFSEPFPARSTIEVAGLPLKGEFEVEGIFLINKA